MLDRASELVARQMGLHFPRERRQDLERGLRNAAIALGYEDIESCFESLVSHAMTKSQVEILASHLTVGETFFYRDKKSFDVFEQHLLTDLVNARRGKEQRLRIWSAGCCTGEEPYSIAISLHKMIPDLKGWNVTILATDINPNFLKKAADGIYGEWSFRSTAKSLREKHFIRRKDGRWQIRPHIQKLVTFAYLNLAEDVYPSLLNNTNAMDVIFCRNVLMYFTPQRRSSVINSIYHSLVEGGWLLVSATETSPVLYLQYATVSFPGMTLYRKGGKQQTSTGTAPRAQVHWEWSPPSTLADAAIQTAEEVDREYQSSPGYTPVPPATPAKARLTEPPMTPSEKASALFRNGQYAQVIDELANLAAPNSLSSADLSLLARAHANLGRLGDALEWCKKSIAADKSNASLCYLQATIQQEQGEMEAATTMLKRALYLDQDFVLAHFTLGNLARQKGKPGESVKHYQNAANLLEKYEQEDVLSDAEGITAGRLKEIIHSITCTEKAT